jgi:hypothetical protein
MTNQGIRGTSGVKSPAQAAASLNFFKNPLDLPRRGG